MRTITVTMNPVLDKSTHAEFILPEKKTRCYNPEYSPGGGGINVSRAIKNLGGESVAVFLAGGQNGKKIESLLTKGKLDFINKWDCSVLVISLGAKGALLARQNDIIEYIVPPTVSVVSTIGAGDSMVAGIVVGCTKGYWHEQAIRYGVAAGTAAIMTPGTELCRKEDTDKIFDWLNRKN